MSRSGHVKQVPPSGHVTCNVKQKIPIFCTVVITFHVFCLSNQDFLEASRIPCFIGIELQHCILHSVYVQRRNLSHFMLSDNRVKSVSHFFLNTGKIFGLFLVYNSYFFSQHW